MSEDAPQWCAFAMACQRIGRMEGAKGVGDEKDRRWEVDRSGLPVRRRPADSRRGAGRRCGGGRGRDGNRRAVRTGAPADQRAGADPRRSAAGDGQAVVEHRVPQRRPGGLLAARLAGDLRPRRQRAGRAADGARRRLQQPRGGAGAAGRPRARGSGRGHRHGRGRTARLHHLLDPRGAAARIGRRGRRRRAARRLCPVPGRAARAVPVLSAPHPGAGDHRHGRHHRAAAVRRVGRRRAAGLPGGGAAAEPGQHGADWRPRLPRGAPAAHRRAAVHAG